MKRMVLIAGAAMAAQAMTANVFAADAAKSAAPATASASADAAAQAAAKTEEARKQLAEMRVQMQELSRKMATLSSEIGESGPRSYAMRYLGDPDRAMIGVVLSTNEGHVTVGALTPDGPAARAGLHGTDVITAIDHQPVDAKDAVDSEKKARALLADLKDGQKVTIDYLRDGKKNSVTVTAVRREAWNWPQFMNQDPDHPFLPKDFNERIRADVDRAQREAERAAERNQKQVEQQVERATRDAARVAERDAMKHTREIRLAMPWWGLNLAPLNADLGRYFGTDKGVLVIAADDESLPGIRAGDVITSIAGESVTRPEDALRALRDQESGKEVPIKLLRDRKTLALNMKAPEFKSIFNMHIPPPPAPAVAPVPAPAAVPAVAPAPSVPAPPAVPAPEAPPAIAGVDD